MRKVTWPYGRIDCLFLSKLLTSKKPFDSIVTETNLPDMPGATPERKEEHAMKVVGFNGSACKDGNTALY